MRHNNKQDKIKALHQNKKSAIKQKHRKISNKKKWYMYTVNVTHPQSLMAKNLN